MIVKTSVRWLLSYTDANLIKAVQRLVAGLTNNLNFDKPNPSVQAIIDALTAFVEALAAAGNGGKELTAIKNAKRAELVSLVRQMAAYVTLTANGDMTKLLSSEFPYQQPSRSKVGDLSAPESPVLGRTKKSGELTAKVKPQRGAGSHIWQIALVSAPDKMVATLQTLGARCLFTGLKAGEVYAVQACAVGATGRSDWSEAAELMAV